MKKKVYFFILIGILVSVLTSCGTSDIIDFVHEDTDMIFYPDKPLNFSDQSLPKYQLNEILFVPLVYRSYYLKDNGSASYAIDLYAYKKDDEKNVNVTVNSVKVEGIKDITLKSTFIPLNTLLKFSDDKNYSNVQSSMIVLVDELNIHDMKLSDNSLIKVTINVKVEKDGVRNTKNFEYLFKTNIETYMIQQ